MHGMPISNVEPRGTPVSSLGAVSPPESRMVSEELFLLRDPLTVDVLVVEATLGCFSWSITAGAVEFASTATDESSIEDGEALSFFGGGVGGTPDFLTAVFLPGVEVEAVEAVDRTELVEIVLFATAGAGVNLLLSTGEGGGFLLATDALEAVEGARERAVLGVERVVLDLTLAVERVDAVDTTLERVPELGVMSDLAVSKVVELSLVDDMVDAGRDNPEGGRSVEDPATVLRTVDA